ncbi:iron chelate uptake ABC transporter family permease subunit [Streptomyces sp. NPDC005047]
MHAGAHPDPLGQAAEEFLCLRPRLFGVAYRILGSAAEAEDVVQETWVRWQNADRDAVHEPGAFLTTVAARLAINLAQSARVRRETYVGPWLPEPVDTAPDPQLGAERAAAVEMAVLLVLEKLNPMERTAYVLREAFDYPYDRVAEILETSKANARQLVSRARRHLADERRERVDPATHRRLLEVFLLAARTGDLAVLEDVLTGVAMSLGFQAVMSLIVYFAPDSEATSMVLYWTMGSFGAATWGSLPVVAVVVTTGILVLHRYGRVMDVLALGDETAASLGVGPDRHRRAMLLLVSLVTGVMVAVSGAIAFIGLVMPHVVRMLVGATHARVLAVAPPAGAIFMVWVDLAARTVVAPRELPLGVITALVGVPVFIALMRRKGYTFGGR